MRFKCCFCLILSEAKNMKVLAFVCHRITLFALASTCGGIVSPICFAVLKLMIKIAPLLDQKIPWLASIIIRCANGAARRNISTAGEQDMSRRRPQNPLLSNSLRTDSAVLSDGAIRRLHVTKILPGIKFAPDRAENEYSPSSNVRIDICNSLHYTALQRR
jgi:hypothetical protein